MSSYFNTYLDSLLKDDDVFPINRKNSLENIVNQNQYDIQSSSIWTSNIDNISYGNIYFNDIETYVYITGDNSSYGNFGSEVINTTKPTFINTFSNLNIKKISSAYNHVIILTETGEVYSTGSNDTGQLGLGDTIQSVNIPTIINTFSESNIKIKDISSGINHSIFLTENGDVYSTGYNQYGQLGLGDTIESVNIPTIINTFLSLNIKIKKISSRESHTIFITENGDVYSTGRNYSGQLGLGNYDNIIHIPTLIDTFSQSNIKIKDVSTRIDGTCFLTENGDVFSTGNNEIGQLGLGDTIVIVNIPTIINTFLSLNEKIKKISSGYYHTIFLTENNDVYGTGDNWYGNLGIGYIEKTFEPKIIKIFSESNIKIKDISTGINHSIFITVNDEIYSTGDNSYGQLGLDSDITEKYVPTLINTFTDLNLKIKHISTGIENFTIFVLNKFVDNRKVILYDNYSSYFNGSLQVNGNTKISKDIILSSSNNIHLKAHLTIGNLTDIQGTAIMAYNGKGKNNIVNASTYWKEIDTTSSFGTSGYFGIAVNNVSINDVDRYGITDGELVQQTHLAITNTGNVGIGKTNPGVKFDVNGTVRGVGAFTNFTGFHNCKSKTSDLYDDKYIGYIVSSSKKYSSINSKYDKNNIKNNIDKKNNDCLPIVELTSKQNDKNVFGIISKVENELDTLRMQYSGGFATQDNKESYDRRLEIAGCGEGFVWISDYNGPLESGDLITSSPIPGICMKQDDDLLHNYTVAKITMDCDFNPALIPVKVIQSSNCIIEYITTSNIVNTSKYKKISRMTSNVLDVSTNTFDVNYNIENKNTVETINTSNIILYLKDENNEYIYENEIDSKGDIVYDYEYEMKYIRLDGTITDVEEYKNSSNVYRMAFVGSCYKCS